LSESFCTTAIIDGAATASASARSTITRAAVASSTFFALRPPSTCPYARRASGPSTRNRHGALIR
jgi:hypothetical protein